MIAHGGAITVDSKLEHGTTFTIYLPQIPQAVKEGELEFRELPSSVLMGKILVIDDEEPLAQLTQELLRTFGFEVMAFTDPAKALEAFRADPESFAVVMTDQVMPGTTGKEVIRELLAIRPDLPTILCTGYGHAMNVNETRSVGITAFLLKPFLKDDLLSAQRKALNT